MTQGQASGAVLAEFAMEVAPVVDRIRMSMMQATFSPGPPPSFRAAGLDEAAGWLLAYLRNAYPDRVVTRTAVRSVFTYHPDKPVDPGIDVLVESGLLVEPVSGDLVLTPAGQRCLEDLHAVANTAAVRSWAHAGQSVATAGPLVKRALEAAWDTGGEAFAVMAPVHLPEQMSEAGLLAERLTGLRFHRFDAHIAAWRDAGYSVPDLGSLSDHERAAFGGGHQCPRRRSLRRAVPIRTGTVVGRAWRPGQVRAAAARMDLPRCGRSRRLASAVPQTPATYAVRK